MNRFLLTATAAALLLTSCVSSGGDAARLVPSDAYAALVVESPAELFRSAESFVQASGLNRFTKGRSLEETLREEIGRNEGYHKALKALDFGRPVVLAVLPDRRGVQDETGVVLWLPLKEDKGSFEAFRSALAGFEGEAALVEGYAVLGLEGPAPRELPGKTADLSRLSSYPADSVKAWINVEALRRDFSDRWGSALKEALRTGEAGIPESGTEDDPDTPYNYNERHFDWDAYERESGGSSLLSSGILSGAAGGAELLNKAAESIATLDFTLGANERGAYVRIGVVPRSDRALGRLAAAAGSARGIPFLKYLEADALVGAASSYDPQALADLVKLYLKTLGMDKLLGAEYFELLESSYAALGGDSAFSFDISVDPDFPKKAERAQSPREVSELLERSLSFEAAGVGSLRDRQAYRSVLRRIGSSGIFDPVFRELRASSGITLKLKTTEGETEGIPYDSIRIYPDEKGPGADPASRAVLEELIKKFTFYAGYSKDKYYTALGNPEKLSSAVRRDGALRPIAEDAAYAAFSKTLPEDTRGVYYVSLRKIFGLVSTFSKDKEKLPSEGLDRLYGYFAASQDRLETGVFLGAGDIRALSALVPAGKGTGPSAF